MNSYAGFIGELFGGFFMAGAGPPGPYTCTSAKLWMDREPRIRKSGRV